MIKFDVDNFDKVVEWRKAVDICCRFLGENGISFPEFVDEKINNYGGYYRNRCVIDVNSTRKPVRNPVRMWSWPGYKVDRTVYGVTAHEVGHHVWFELRVRKRAAEWYKIVYGNPKQKVSGYEANISEAFAESIRLLILNPGMLRDGCPARWKWLAGSGGLGLGLKMIFECDRWREMFVESEKHLKAAARWEKVPE